MNDQQKHISYYLTLLLVIGGMICLNAHRLTHISENTDSHQSTSVPDENISDECVLCTVSTFGFADFESPQYTPDYSKTEIVANLSTTFLSQRLNPVSVPRAPPFV